MISLFFLSLGDDLGFLGSYLIFIFFLMMFFCSAVESEHLSFLVSPFFTMSDSLSVGTLGRSSLYYFSGMLVGIFALFSLCAIGSHHYQSTNCRTLVSTTQKLSTSLELSTLKKVKNCKTSPCFACFLLSVPSSGTGFGAAVDCAPSAHQCFIT